MKKYLSIFILFSMLISSFFCLESVPAKAIGIYDYAIDSKSDNPVIKQGENVILWVEIKNTGANAWLSDDFGSTPNPFRLGTIRPTDRNSGFFTSGNWIATNRVHRLDNSQVNIGDISAFGFYATAPWNMAPGTYKECFAPVVEGNMWLADRDICWDIKVVANNYNQVYQASPVGNQNQQYTLVRYQEQEVEFKVKNTGNTIWYRDGQYPVHLGVVNDVNGELYHGAWLNSNRPAGLSEAQVNPGETGTFRFKILTEVFSDIDQMYYVDNFWLVVENKQWFSLPSNNDYLKVEVKIKEADDNPPDRIKVLSMAYIPTTSNGSVDTSQTGDWHNSSFSETNNYISNANTQLIQNLEEATRYHGYNSANYLPALDYQLLSTFIFSEPIPVEGDNNFPNHQKIFSDESIGVNNICDYVDNQDVKEVWIWMYHDQDTVPIESNMSMGKNIREYWNYGNYGDVSNSYRSNDLPICDNSYTVYEYNYGRGQDTYLENHTHHIEAVMSYVDQPMWSKFVGKQGEQSDYYRCGWTHYPPNVMEYSSGHDYDWTNPREVFSDCEDWRPDGGGQKKLVSCDTWGCANDGGVNFKIWWMQNIPGNNFLEGEDGLKNWWTFIGNFDQAITDKSLSA